MSDDLEIQIIDWYNADVRADIEEDEDDPPRFERAESDEEEEMENTFEEYVPRFSSRSAVPHKKENRFKIIIFGRDQLDRTYSVSVSDFTPYFYVKVPDFFTKHETGLLMTWLTETLSARIPNFNVQSIVRANLVERMRFRGFTNFRKFKFVRFVFTNLSTMRAAIKCFQKVARDPEGRETPICPASIEIAGISTHPVQYDLYDTMIDPLLRYIHHQDIKPCGWIRIPAGTYKPCEDTSLCQFNYQVEKWSVIEPLTRDTNVGFKVMAFDIEADSAHGDFPLPKKDYMKLAREIRAEYERLVKIHENDKTAGLDPMVPTNIKALVKSCLCAAFTLKGDRSDNISIVYPRTQPSFTAKTVELLTSKIADKMEWTRNLNATERNKERTKNIADINRILNAQCPPLHGDKTIQIGCAFMRFGEKKPFKQIILTLGECNKWNPDIEVQSFSEETDLICAFTTLVQDEDPDIITGYNSEGFDIPWLFKRADDLGILDHFNKLSRLPEYPCLLREKQVKGPTGDLIKIEFADIPGRVQMDVLRLIQKGGYNLESYKLDDVSAEFMRDTVKTLSIQGSTTTITTGNVTGLNIGNFITFTEVSGYLEIKYQDGRKFQVIDIQRDGKKAKIVVDGRVEIEMPAADDSRFIRWSLGKDDVGPHDIFRLQKGTASDRAIIAKYCMMDVVLTLELMLKLELMNNNMGMANVCLAPLSYIIQRGQGVKILSLLANFLRKKDYVMPLLYKNTADRDKYEGAFVLTPKPAMYLDEPVSVLDYGSLYPSSMIERNLSQETKCDEAHWQGEEGAKRIRELGLDFVDVEYDQFETTYTAAGTVKDRKPIGKKTVRFVQYADDKKGIMPEILQYLVGNRKSTRNKIGWQTITLGDGTQYTGAYSEKNGRVVIKGDRDRWEGAAEEIVSKQDTYNDFQKAVLDGLQLAFKVVANSLYGFIGAKTSAVYDKEIAASTTATGRERLMLAKAYAENPENFPQTLRDGRVVHLHNKVIYGDTDSIFIKIELIDDEGKKMTGRPALEKSIAIASEMENQIQKLLKKPQVLEYEKTFMPFMIFSKKRYVGHLYEKDPDEYHLKSMGIVTKRRDNAPIVKIIYGGIIDIIMNQRRIEPACTYLRKTLRRLVNGEFPLESLVITKSLASYYKDPEKIAHKVLADRIAERDPGNKPKVGDRMPFVYIQLSKRQVQSMERVLQGDKIETPSYIKSQGLIPDYEFYITNQIMKPVSQIFALCLEDIPGYKNNHEWNWKVAAGEDIDKVYHKLMDRRSKEVQSLLFADCLRVLENQRSGNRPITAFFGKN